MNMTSCTVPTFASESRSEDFAHFYGRATARLRRGTGGRPRRQRLDLGPTLHDLPPTKKDMLLEKAAAEDNESLSGSSSRHWCPLRAHAQVRVRKGTLLPRFHWLLRLPVKKEWAVVTYGESKGRRASS